MGRHLITAVLVAQLVACSAGVGDSEADPATTSEGAPRAEETTTTIESAPLSLLIDVIGNDGNGQQIEAAELGAACGGAGAGRGAYGYVGQFANVTVRDGEGEVLATESLGPGEITSITPAGNEWLCAWKLDLGDIPLVPFYEVDINGEASQTFDAEYRESHENRLVVTLT